MVSKEIPMTAPNACLMKGAGYCPKPLEQIAGFLSKKWTLSIMVTIGNFEKVRFNDLLQRISTINPKTLSDRLKELAKLGLLQRKAFKQIPPKVEYT